MRNFSPADIFFSIYASTNIFFQLHLRANNFPMFFFSVFFLFVLNITIALLNYFTKNAISSAIATYFVDKRSTHFLNFFWQLLTQIKGIRQEIGVAGFFAIPHYQTPDPL